MKLSGNKGFFSHQYDDTDSYLTTSKPLEITELETPYDKRRVPIASVRYLAGSRSPSNRGNKPNCDTMSDWSDARSAQSDVYPDLGIDKSGRSPEGDTGSGERCSNKYDSLDINAQAFQENDKNIQHEALNFNIRRHIQNYLSNNTYLRRQRLDDPHVSRTPSYSSLSSNRELGFKYNIPNQRTTDRNDRYFDLGQGTIGMGHPSILDSLVRKKAPHFKNSHNLGYIHTNQHFLSEGFIDSKNSQGWNNIANCDGKNGFNLPIHADRAKNVSNSYYLEHCHNTYFNTKAVSNNSHRLHTNTQNFEPAHTYPGNNNHYNLNFQETIHQTVESAVRNVLDTYVIQNKDIGKKSVSDYNFTGNNRCHSNFNILRDGSGDETCIFKSENLLENQDMSTVKSCVREIDVCHNKYCFTDRVNGVGATEAHNVQDDPNHPVNYIGIVNSDPFSFDLKKLSTELEDLHLSTKPDASGDNFINLGDTISGFDTFKGGGVNGTTMSVSDFLECADNSKLNELYRPLEKENFKSRERHEDSLSDGSSGSNSVRTEITYHNSIFAQETEYFQDSVAKSYNHDLLTKSPVLFGKVFKSSREYDDHPIRSEDGCSSESISNSELFAPYLNNEEEDVDSTTPQNSSNSDIGNHEILKRVQDLELYIKRLESSLSKEGVSERASKGASNVVTNAMKENIPIDQVCDDGSGKFVSTSELMEGYKAASVIKKLLHVQSMESLIPAFTAFVQNRLGTPKM